MVNPNAYVDLLLFDMDDTLIFTSPLYMDIVEKAKRACRSKGISEKIFMQAYIHKEQTKNEGTDFNKDNFPNSLYETILELTGSISWAVHYKSLAYGVYEKQAETNPDAEETINRIKSVRKAVVTKGDMFIQMARLVDSGLIHYFEQVFVVPRKTSEIFTKICDYMGVSPEKTAMIGDSLVSDISPALEAGLYAFHKPFGTFDHEGFLQNSPEDSPRYTKINRLQEVSILIRGERDGSHV